MPRWGSALGVLRHEALVVVLVAREDHFRSRLVKCFPQRFHSGGAAVFYPRAEARVVHVGQSALPLISVGGEVLLEPLRFGEPGPQRTSSQLLLRATTCQLPRSYE